MKKIILAVITLLAAIFIIRFVIGGPEDNWICVEGVWVKHGNPKAEKPASGCGEEPTGQAEICTSESGKQMIYNAAKQIAENKCKNGDLKENHFCNSNSGTWWIDFTPNEPREGCNPACVIFVDSQETEINWRCTGLIIPTP